MFQRSRVDTIDRVTACKVINNSYFLNPRNKDWFVSELLCCWNDVFFCQKSSDKIFSNVPQFNSWHIGQQKRGQGININQLLWQMSANIFYSQTNLEIFCLFLPPTCLLWSRSLTWSSSLSLSPLSSPSSSSSSSSLPSSSSLTSLSTSSFSSSEDEC